MRFIIKTILLAALCYLIQSFVSVWWIIAVIAFIVPIIVKSNVWGHRQRVFRFHMA